jgi:hypothetical protein
LRIKKIERRHFSSS